MFNTRDDNNQHVKNDGEKRTRKKQKKPLEFLLDLVF